MSKQCEHDWGMLGDVVHMDSFPRGSVTYFCSTRYQLHSSETWSDDPMVAVRKLPTVMVYKAPATRIREEHVSGLGARPRARVDWILRNLGYARRFRGFKALRASWDSLERFAPVLTMYCM